MGMNYYLLSKKLSHNPKCYHIGKSSYGWLFNFQVQNNKYDEPPVVWNTFEEVKNTLKKYTVDSKEWVIIDEEDNIISLESFISIVECKQYDEFNLANPDNFTYSKNINGYRFSEGDFD